MRRSVNIFGVIGLETLAQWFIPEVQQIGRDPNINTLVVNITSTPGGDLPEGLAIYDALMLFKKETGKKVITRGSGFVGSISSVIFMAGDERELTESTTFYIHNPFASKATGGAEDLRKIANYIDDQEAQARKIYQSGTTLSNDDVDFLMETEVYLTAEEAFTLGFSTSTLHLTEILLKSKNDMTKFSDEFKKLFPVLGGGGTNPKLLALNLSDGRTANIQTDKENPVPGDPISVGGKPLEDGDYKTQSGFMLKVKAGKVEEVNKEEVTNEEILQALLGLNGRMDDFEKRTEAVEVAALALARGQVSGSFTPPAVGIPSKPTDGEAPREAPKMQYETVHGAMKDIRERARAKKNQ